MNEKTSKIISNCLRWPARIVGSLLVMLMLFIFIGEAVTDFGGPLPKLSIYESLEFIAVGVMISGVVLAWKRERRGAWMCILGGMAFIIIESIEEAAFRPIWFPFVYLGVGLTLLAAHWFRPLRAVE